MGGGLREAADGGNYVFAAQFACVIDCLSRNQFSQRRTASHGRDASLGLEAYFGNAPGAELQCQSQHVSAGGVFNFDRRIRIGNIAGVARVLKVIKRWSGIHRNDIVKRTTTGLYEGAASKRGNYLCFVPS